MRAILGTMHTRSFILSVMLGALLSHAGDLSAQQPGQPPAAYVRLDSGWLGLFGRGAEYARFPVIGPDVHLQDAGHILLRPGLGLMVTFTPKQDLPGADLLSAHLKWETDYWRQHAATVDTVNRADLTSGRDDIRVTELHLANAAGNRMVIGMVSLRAAEGVFTFAFSPDSPAVDSVVTRFVKSLELVHRPLTPDEMARISQSVKK